MSERSNKGWKWCLLFLLIYTIGLYFYTTHKLSRIKPIEIERIDTVTVSDTIYEESRDTFYLTKPIPELIEIVRIDTVKEETVLITEQKTYQDTLCKDNDSIILTNIIQGINAQLLSTEVDWRKQDRTITNTIEITKYIKDKKRLNFGLQVGYGYATKSKELSPYVGLGLTIKF